MHMMAKEFGNLRRIEGPFKMLTMKESRSPPIMTSLFLSERGTF